MSHSYPVTFELLATDATSDARRGRLHTPQGPIETPIFMPVGTQATVKTLDTTEVASLGFKMILANTYHLMLRPGVDLLKQAGGVREFMRWPHSLLTDSGGFQIFSLATQAKVREEGVSFQSHIDGSRWNLTPEEAIRLQIGYGSTIMMALDHLVGLPAERKKIHAAMERTHRWLDRAVAHHKELGGNESGNALFGIVQGGMEADFRVESAQFIAQSDVAGCAIGGLSVGEPKPVMSAMIETVNPHLPKNKPRYLMGVGSPEDLWMGVARGVDMFDCVLPTRLARNGALFTPTGRINIKQRRWRERFAPVFDDCDCPACQRYDAAYIHHLFRAGEILGLRLASMHNLRFLARETEKMRTALDAGTFDAAYREFASTYVPAKERATGEVGSES
ncbi:tRNA guanosine(34) transglycosylase Tgt [soil metagenome]